MTCVPCHAQITLTEVARYNLLNTRNAEAEPGVANPLYTGNSTSAVAWNGSRLFIAGINNTSPSDITGIIEILNTATTGIVPSTAVQYGSRFGAQAGTVDLGRGYSGLTLSGNRLYAAWDNDSGNNGLGQFAAYDISAADASTLWTTDNRGSAGVAIDPGYVVSGSSLGGAGVGWATFGGGSTNPPGAANRRALTDPLTGAFIYGFGASGTVPAGFDWRPVGATGVGRDISFDPDTGNLYGRSNNLVTAAVRTGTNSASPVTFIGGTASGGSASGQNIAFMSNTVAGDLLAFNNRQSTGASQTFTQAVRLMSTSGSVQSVNWNFLGGASYGNQVVTGPIYDFAFDPVSQTLAVVGAQSTLGLSIFRFGSPDPTAPLQWAADGTTPGGSGTWGTSGTTWNGDYGPGVWNSAAQAVFTGTIPTSAVTVAPGGVSVGRGMSFVTNGYAVGGGAITLTGATASTNNLNVEPGVSATVNSEIASAAGLSKSGAGTLVVGGTISGGGVSVNAGVLEVVSTGRIQPTAPGGVTVLTTGTLNVTQLPGGYAIAAGTSLGGGGTVQGAVVALSGGTISPGSSIESLALGATTLANGASFAYEVDSTNVGSLSAAADLLVVDGDLNLDAGNGTLLKITDLNSSPNSFTEGTTMFAMINYSGTWNGGVFTYNGNVLADDAQFSVGSQKWQIDYNRASPAGLTNFNSDYLPSSSFVTLTAVPEPATFAIALAGLVGGYSMFRRRRAR